MAASTVRMDRVILGQLLTQIGDRPMTAVTVADVEEFRVSKSRSMGANSLNTVRAVLRSFFGWCRQTGLMTADPMLTWRVRPVMPGRKLFIPPQDFPVVLGAAVSPRDRVFIALGLYTFLRQSEITDLRIADLDLTRDEIEVTIHKTSQRDLMPICSELRSELDRWLHHYRQEAPEGLLDPEWYLVPAQTRQPRPGGRLLCPQSRFRSTWRNVQTALDVAGLPYDRGEGGHTLRRSGARALYDHLVAQGHDYAIRRVQSMLHHSSIAMTERYLGVTADIKRRNESLRGRPMFPPVAVPSAPILPLGWEDGNQRSDAQGIVMAG